MPAVSKKQQQFMAICAHSPGKSKGKCPSKEVAMEFSHKPKGGYSNRRYKGAPSYKMRQLNLDVVTNEYDNGLAMITDFSPKKQFQANNTLTRELLNVVGSDNFHAALSSSISEYVYRRTPTSEQLTAVREFIHTLLTLASPDQPMPTYPAKTLDHTVYDTTKQPVHVRD